MTSFLRGTAYCLAMVSSIAICERVHGADECKDVLVNKVFDMQDIRTDSYYTSVVLASLDQSQETAWSRRTKGGIEIEGIPISLSNDEAKRIRDNLSYRYSFSAVRRDRASVLLLSGQERIINAWRECMTERGGPSVRFEVAGDASGKMVNVHIEYFGKPGIAVYPPLRLAEAILIDPSVAEVRANKPCLAKDMEYKPGDSCRVELVMKSAWAELSLVARLVSPTGAFASPSAYLAPRVRIRGITQPWRASSDWIYTKDHSVVGEEKCVSPPEGFVYLRDTLRTTARPDGESVAARNCFVDHHLDSTGTELCFNARITGVGRTADHYCTPSVTGTIASAVWEPSPPVSD